MRKSELLKHVPERMPDDTESMMELFKACGEDVIMVCGYPSPIYSVDRKRFAAHFTWRHGYLTWYADNGSGTWTKESADMAGFSIVSLVGKPVQKFAARNGMKHCSDIDLYERQLRWRKQEEAERKKQKKVDDIINTYVPPLPHGFRQKITAMAKDVKPGKKIHIKMFQNTHDAVVERMFAVTKNNPKDEGQEYPIEIMEICDAFTADYGDAWESWYYGQHYNAIGRQQSFWPYKRGMIGNLPTKYLIYDNFAEENFSRKQESCLKIMNGLCDPSALLNRLHWSPDLEQLIKSGMTRLAAELCDPWFSTEDIQDRIESLKQADRQLVKRIRENNAGWNAAQFMAVNPKLDAKWIREIIKIKSQYKMDSIWSISNRGLNMNHVLRLLSKTGGIKENNLQTYLDYLRMAEARGSDIHDEIIYRNKRWRQFHDAYVEENLRRQQEERDIRDREEARKRKQEYRRRFAGIWRDYRRNKDIFAWEKDGCRIVVPRSYADIIDEGQKQHHCVGSCGGRYMESMSQRKTWILFLRHTENPREPWYTIETDGKAVLQFYAAYDRQPDKETVQKILAEWMNQVRKNKAKVEKKEEEERESQKLEEAGKAAGGCADQPVMQAAS